MMQFTPTAKTHTPNGIAQLSIRLMRALIDRYLALAESMFRWEDSSGKCDTMFEISRHHVPEKYLLWNAFVGIFDYGGETHMLPVAHNGNINIYGYPTEWRVVPQSTATVLGQELQNLKLNNDNSVIVENSLYGTYDAWVITDMVTMWVDTVMTLYQRTLTARSPYIVSVGDMKDSDASSFISAILNYAPAIIRNARGSMLKTEVLDMNVALDPQIMEACTYFKSQLLIYIGYRGTDIYKRAQQTVPEINMPQEEIRGRWQEKLRCRQKAVEKYNKKFGNNITVDCICEEMDEYIDTNQPDVLIE